MTRDEAYCKTVWTRIPSLVKKSIYKSIHAGQCHTIIKDIYNFYEHDEWKEIELNLRNLGYEAWVDEDGKRFIIKWI